jgi:heme exporter protein D
VIAFRYTVMRLMIFAGFLALLILLGAEMIWAAVGAALLSMVVSYFLLARDREVIAAGIERRVEDRVARRRAQLESERTAEEDEDAELDGRG